ncbi:MAG: hypothetical protein DDT32_00611 [Syntrophomonadaceae bacterium]|nr:hypothetical protein [Bacillota bacterium]MBT9146864.1 hypothetical protein [Bacillota bacterium]
MVPWNDVMPIIRSGRETSRVELKEKLSLGNASEKATFAKDVAALANTPGGDSFIIVGVIDFRHRTPDMDIIDALKDFEVGNPDGFQIQMNDILANYTDPPVIIQYVQERDPEYNRLLGIIKISASTSRPHLISKSGSGIRRGEIWYRRESQNSPASREEVFEMCGDRWRREIENVFQSAREEISECEDYNTRLEFLAKDLAQRLYHKLAKAKRKDEISKRFESCELKRMLENWDWERW